MDIQVLLEELFAQYDSSLDISQGSALRTQVIDPVVAAYTADPTSTDVRGFLVSKYNETFPDSPLARGDAISDILITACEVFLDGYRVELNKLKTASSVANIDNITLDDAELLAANWFVSVQRGTRAVGLVTVSVDRVAPISIEESVRFYTSDNLEFKPLFARTITQQELFSSQTSENLFTFSLYVTAISEGSNYNIEPNEIVDVTGILNVRTVTNNTSFSGGEDSDTARSLLQEKVPAAISERSLVTSRGIIATISNRISTIEKFQVIGMEDPEMQRDRVSVSSFSESLGYGIGWFIGTTGLISLLGHKTLSSGNVLIHASDGEEYELTSVSLIEGQSGTFIRGSLMYFVEIDNPFSSPQSFTFTAARKASALLDKTLIDSTVSLGGMVDVYVQPSTHTTVTVNRSKSSDYEDTVTGDRYETFGTNLVHLYPKSDKLVRNSVLSLGDSDFRILEIVGDPTDQFSSVRVDRVIDASDTSEEWVYCRDIKIYLGRDYELIEPRSEAQPLLATGASQTQQISINRLITSAQPGDTLTLVDGRTFTIESVQGLQIGVSSYIDDAFSLVSCEIRRAIISMPQPISYISRLSKGESEIKSNCPLGVEASLLESTDEIISFGTGIVSPSFRAALLDFRSRYGEKSVISSTTSSGSGYSLHSFEVADSEETEYKNQRLAYSRGYKTPKISNCVVTALGNDASAVDAGTHVEIEGGYITEVELFNELFLSNTRNIFFALGDIEDNDRYVPYPLENARRGDILRITSGVNSGSYVICEVVHNLIPVNSDNILEAVSHNTDTGITAVSLDAQYGSESQDPLDGVQNPVFQKVSIVKIYGEFKNNALLNLEEYLRFGDTPSIQDSNLLDDPFRPISLSVLSRMFNNPISLIDTSSLRTEMLDSLNRTNTNVPRCSFELDEKLLNKYLEHVQQDTEVSYQIVKPTRSKGVMYAEADPVSLYPLSSSNINLDVLLSGLTDLNSEYIVPTYTTFTLSNNVAVLDPSYANYLQGEEDISSWPLLSLDNPIRHDYVKSDFSYYTSTSASADYDVINTSLTISNEEALYSPSTLLVHEEIFPTFYSELVQSEFLFEWLPYVSDNPIDETFLYGENSARPEGHTILLRTRDELLNELSQYLDHVRVGGATLRETINLYGSYIKIEDVSGILDQLGTNLPIPLRGANNNIEEISIPAFSIQYYRSGQNTRNLELPTLTVGRSRLGTSLVELIQLDSNFSNILPGSVAVISNGEDRFISSVSSFDQTTGYLSLQSELPFEDATIFGMGSLFYNTSNDKCQTGVGSYYEQTDNILTLKNTEVDSGLGTVDYVLSSADVGRHISIFGVVYSYTNKDHMYGDQQLSIVESAPSTLDELRGEAHVPTRVHIGTYTIEAVTNTNAVDPFSGSQVVISQEIELSSSSSDIPSILESQLSRSSTIRVHYVVTEAVGELSDKNELRGLSTVQIYEQLPTEYSLVGYAVDLSQRMLVSAVSVNQSLQDLDLFEHETLTVGEDSYQICTSFNKNSPYNILSTSLSTIADLEEVSLLGVDIKNSIEKDVLSVQDYASARYKIYSDDERVQRSIFDQPVLTISPATWVGNDLDTSSVSITAQYSNVVSNVQAIVDATENRVLCADTQVRELLPCFIGMNLSYSGPVGELQVAQYLQKCVSDALSSNSSLNVSEIIYKLRNIGVTNVALPIDLYFCVEDLRRERYRRNIQDVLDASRVYDIIGTSRLISIKPAPYTHSLLGAQISVTRVGLTRLTTGNGGT